MSPIEAQLLEEIRAVADESTDLQVFDDIDSAELGAGSTYFVLRAAHAIGSYKADIFIEGTFSKLAIECDGHDFHDRTKQQAAYDRSRDRELLLLGVTTIRYTGSEIHHSARRCAVEIWKIARLLEEREELVFDAIEAQHSARKVDTSTPQLAREL